MTRKRLLTNCILQFVQSARLCLRIRFAALSGRLFRAERRCIKHDDRIKRPPTTRDLQGGMLGLRPGLRSPVQAGRGQARILQRLLREAQTAAKILINGLLYIFLIFNCSRFYLFIRNWVFAFLSQLERNIK